jgi:hypothetical protein
MDGLGSAGCLADGFKIVEDHQERAQAAAYHGVVIDD